MCLRLRLCTGVEVEEGPSAIHSRPTPHAHSHAQLLSLQGHRGDSSMRAPSSFQSRGPSRFLDANDGGSHPFGAPPAAAMVSDPSLVLGNDALKALATGGPGTAGHSPMGASVVQDVATASAVMLNQALLSLAIGPAPDVDFDEWAGGQDAVHHIHGA